MFDREKCSIPVVYCGDKTEIPRKPFSKDTHYVRKGTSRECLSKGFGSGMITEKLKHLSIDSLQRIKYVGEKYEKKFIEVGIKSTTSLLRIMGNSSRKEIEKSLKAILVKKNGILDMRAYNSVILFLLDNGITRLPECVLIN